MSCSYVEVFLGTPEKNEFVGWTSTDCVPRVGEEVQVFGKPEWYRVERVRHELGYQPSNEEKEDHGLDWVTGCIDMYVSSVPSAGAPNDGS